MRRISEAFSTQTLDHLGIAAVSAHALRTYGIAVQFAHMDTTAFSLQATYAFDKDEGLNDDSLSSTCSANLPIRPDPVG